MGIEELERIVDEARRRLDELPQTVSEAERERFWTIHAAHHEQLLEAERALALARGDETALACDWPVSWDTGAPLPHLLCSGHKTFLIYYAGEDHGPGPWRTLKLRSASSPSSEPIAVAEFTRCYTCRFGGPNDEVLRGHPLFGKGLDAYAAHVVENSAWLREAEEVNRVHPGYRREHWTHLKHYLLLFHDELFECLAGGFTVEHVHPPMPDVIAQYAARLAG